MRVRTTVVIDDDLLVEARSIARARRVSLGRVVSDLMRRGLDLRIADRDGFPIFDVPSDARPITSEAVKRAEDEW